MALYLFLVTVMVLRSDPGRIRREADLQDEGRLTIPVLTVIAGMASLGAIVFWLRSASESGSTQPLYLALMFLTTLLSWLFIHTMFALHYAHECYAEHRGQGGGMRFPETDAPDYWDFVYFSFVIGTSTAVSDVAHHLPHDQADGHGPRPRGVRLQRDDDRFNGLDRRRRDLF